MELLTSFPNLTDLKIDLTDQNQVLLILSQIPKLIMLNGKSTKDAVTIVDVDEKEVDGENIKSTEKPKHLINNTLNIFPYKTTSLI